MTKSGRKATQRNRRWTSSWDTKLKNLTTSVDMQSIMKLHIMKVKTLNNLKSVPWSSDLERFYCITRYVNNIGRALFQNALSVNPKMKFAMPMPSLEIMLWNKALHNYTHIDAYYTYVKRSFPKHNLWPWCWHCKSILWNGAYRVLGKSSSYAAS